MGALSIQGIRKRYGAVEILKGIDLEIAEGGFLILVGPSGCGKSTLLSMIAGLDTPSEGRITLGARDITHLPSKDRDIAMVFQSYALYPNMSVAQNIAFALEMRKVPAPAREAAVARVAKMLQIEHLLRRKPAALSGGQRQRVAMGRALARDPKLFLFDEPLSNLDAKLRVEMRAEIKLLHQRTRTTTVYVTHDQIEAMTLGDRIAVMNGGVVEQFGSPADIYARPATRFVAEFVGSPVMNLVDAAVQGGSLQAGGQALPVTDAQQASLSGRDGQTVAWGLRPEDLQLVGGEAAGDAAPARLNGTVTMVEPTGPETYVKVDTPAGLLTARLPGAPSLAPGMPAQLAWSPARTHLFAAGDGRRIA